MNSDKNKAIFRFYAELNDFLPPGRRQRTITYLFYGAPAVKDAIEALGVPHVEVDLVLVNGQSVDFSYLLHHGDRVAVYPVFESLDISPIVRLRPEPLRQVTFVNDVHLAKLARLLRLLGFDTVYSNGATDAQLARISSQEGRILLTRDRDLLKRGVLTHGYWVRSTDSIEQAREVIDRFDLFVQVHPFTRCLSCNGCLTPVEKDKVLASIPPRTARWQDEYFICQHCGKLYWRGTHYLKLKKVIAKILARRKPSGNQQVEPT